MMKRWEFWVLSVIGALCVVFVIANMVLFSGNRALQSEVDQRNQYIEQSLQLQGLYQQIVRAVADLSVRNHDEQLRAVLAKQGIQVTSSAQPPAGAASAGTAASEGNTTAPVKQAAPMAKGQKHGQRGRHHE